MKNEINKIKILQMDNNKQTNNQEQETKQTNDVNEAAVEETQESVEVQDSKLKDQLLRLAAEMENLRKRTAREIEEAHKFGITKFARDMIEVLENLYRAESSVSADLIAANDSIKQIQSGVELTRKSMVDIFERHGLKRIFPLGEEFNHDLHQAVTQVPAPEFEDGKVANVIQAGYTLHDRLIRPALVVVAKNN